MGSPPRMRGRDASRLRPGAAERITPAYAGKSTGGTDAGKPRQDHPRVCGEENPASMYDWIFAGSPPRMRGRVKVTVCQRFRAGITPTYAGKSSFACCPWRLHWDHPRVCGEEPLPGFAAMPPQGSPPRMRGRDTWDTRPCSSIGITPAYAGKRHVCNAPCKGMGDHPRVCGEEQTAPPRL